MHKATQLRFDEDLAVAEDLEFGLRLWAASGTEAVRVVPEPLVDVYPQNGDRVNANFAALRRTSARVLHAQGRRFSRGARRRFLLRTLLAQAKLARKPLASVMLSWALLRESRGKDWRACANACLVAAGVAPQRWVS
jgi:hypothetical protein